MTDFNKYQFVAEKKEGPWKRKIRVWKYSDNSKLFYLVSPPYDKNEPKVQPLDFIETGLRLDKFEKYTKSNNIFEKLNLMWNAFSDTWEYDGKTYFADCDSDLRDAPWHHEFGIPYKIGYYHGKLVWVSGFQYSPKVCFIRFESIDKKPDLSKQGFTSIRNIKPVYSNSKQCYI
jgi:hypothetical protein